MKQLVYEIDYGYQIQEVVRTNRTVVCCEADCSHITGTAAWRAYAETLLRTEAFVDPRPNHDCVVCDEPAYYVMTIKTSPKAIRLDVCDKHKQNFTNPSIVKLVAEQIAHAI